MHSYHFAPYTSAQFFNSSTRTTRKWSDTAVYVGLLIPTGKHLEFNPYYEHRNNTWCKS
jgi:hypothetical protein